MKMQWGEAKKKKKERERDTGDRLVGKPKGNIYIYIFFLIIFQNSLWS